MSAEIGDRIGQYRISREIGRGGMGVIYEAIHTEIGRHAAIKLLSPGGADDPHYASRFLNEARAISHVRHAGLVQIYDFGQTPAGAPFILMELLDGETLRARMARQPRLTLAEIRRVVRQIAVVLAATHAQGVAHLDLKPDNVMLVLDEEAPGGERVKLLDFGIARFFAVEDSALARPGYALGTIAYMSPEQCIGAPDIGRAADVYALGVILYELLAGTRPFAGPAGTTMMRKHVAVAPAPLPADAPADLAALAARMLAKEPTRRPSMREIVDALPEPKHRHASRDATAEDQNTTRTWPVTAQPRRARWVALVAAVVTGAIAWLAYLAVREPALSPSPAPPMTGMVWFHGGTFRMGHTAEEIARECQRLGAQCRREVLEREQPARDVTLSPFYLDKLEATNDEVAQWLGTMVTSLEVRVDDENNEVKRLVYLDGIQLLDLWPPHSGIEPIGDGRWRARRGDERKPAAQLTWDAASLYCKSRGKRLPTEAEWEFAARGPTGRRFPWGEQEPGCDDVVWGRETACASGSRPRAAVAVGTAPLDSTPEGVRDLGGNVVEWVQDQFRQPFYPPCISCMNPLVEAPTPLVEDSRMIRGGSWRHDWPMTRTTMRGNWKRTEVMKNGGVRCAIGGP